MTTYVHTLTGWPKVHWSDETLVSRLAAVRHNQGRLIGRMDGLGFWLRAFLAWFNAQDSVDPVLRAALAHLWFVTIHPFNDGNGRIARAIADMELARSE